MCETLLDGNRCAEIYEWCEKNLAPDSWQFMQIDQIHESVSSPVLLKWRWFFKSDQDYSLFKRRWPHAYQLVFVYADTGSGSPHMNGSVNKNTQWDNPDAWCAWAQSVGINLETQRVHTTGPWHYTMGETMPHKFDVRYLRFGSKEDVAMFILMWGTPA